MGEKAEDTGVEERVVLVDKDDRWWRWFGEVNGQDEEGGRGNRAYCTLLLLVVVAYEGLPSHPLLGSSSDDARLTLSSSNVLALSSSSSDKAARTAAVADVDILIAGVGGIVAIMDIQCDSV